MVCLCISPQRLHSSLNRTQNYVKMYVADAAKQRKKTNEVLLCDPVWVFHLDEGVREVREQILHGSLHKSQFSS